MRFITNNVNVILMSTIVLLAIFGVAYYNYQEIRFQSVHLENAQLEAQVAQLETNLSAQEARLRSIFGELQEQLQDSVRFENLYSEVTSEREALESDLSDLESSLEQERQDRLIAERESRDLKNRITVLENDNAILRESVMECSEDLDRCELELTVC